MPSRARAAFAASRIYAKDIALPFWLASHTLEASRALMQWNGGLSFPRYLGMRHRYPYFCKQSLLCNYLLLIIIGNANRPFCSPWSSKMAADFGGVASAKISAIQKKPVGQTSLSGSWAHWCQQVAHKPVVFLPGQYHISEERACQPS